MNTLVAIGFSPFAAFLLLALATTIGLPLLLSHVICWFKERKKDDPPLTLY